MAEDVFGIVGTTLGSFQVERVIAEGGFGVVYRAQHGAFRAPVALKCLKVPGGMTPEQRAAFIEKFREEAELLFRLSASIPEVVRPLHADVMNLDAGRFAPFLVLEWLEGESLDELIHQRRARGQAPLGLHKLVRLLRPIAQALARAHRFPGPTGPIAIIHRDLKPENIFVRTAEGVTSVKILDFGIATAKSATTRIAGRSTSDDPLASFTPAYAAPEQWVPKRYGQAGPWTDVWGLAITMVEALSGRSPVDGDFPTMMGTVLDESRRPTPRNENVVVSDEVERVFSLALAVDPRNRTKDIETFWNDLELAMGEQPSFSSRDPRRDSIDGAPSGPVVLTTASARGAMIESLAPRSRMTDPRREESVPAPVAETTPPAAHHAVGERELELSPRATSDPASAPVDPAHLAPPPSPAAFAASVAPLQRGVGSVEGVSWTPSGAPPISAPFSPPSIEPRSVSGPPALLQVALSAPPISRPRATATFAEPRMSRTTQLEMGRLREKLRRPIQLIVVALAITVADVLVASTRGELLFVGPVRPLWIAGPMALAGVGLAFWRVFGGRDDD
jgi:serine/threonine-protein kinase